MSTPRVGSSSDQHAGRGQQPACASSTFCWLPPERLATVAVRSARGRRDARRSSSSARRRSRRLRSDAEPAERSPRWGSVTFSTTGAVEQQALRACGPRARSAMPAATASRGARSATGAPSSRQLAASARSAPKSARAARCGRCRPARRGRRSRRRGRSSETSAKRAGARQPAHLKTGAARGRRRQPVGVELARARARASRATSSSRSFVRRRRRVRTSWPSRRTVTASAESQDLVEEVRDEEDRACRRASSRADQVRAAAATRRAVSAAVGSSMTISSRVARRARAISTFCWRSARLSDATARPGRARSRAASSTPASPLLRAPVTKPARRLGRRGRRSRRPSARRERELLMRQSRCRARGRRAASAAATASPSIASVPASGRNSAGDDLASVDLPAPFSPTSAWNGAAIDLDVTSFSACAPKKLFPRPVAET